MCRESVEGVWDAFLVSGKGFLNIKLLKFFQSLIKHDVAIKHIFYYGFQAGAYLHLFPVLLSIKQSIKSGVCFRLCTKASSWRTPNPPDGGTPELQSKRFSHEQFISLEITRSRCGSHLRRQRRRRRLLVPGNSLEVVAHKLFVERSLGFADLVAFNRPETRRIGRQSFVDQDDSAVTVTTELELGIGDNDFATACIVACLLIKT